MYNVKITNTDEIPAYSEIEETENSIYVRYSVNFSSNEGYMHVTNLEKFFPLKLRDLRIFAKTINLERYDKKQEHIQKIMRSINRSKEKFIEKYKRQLVLGDSIPRDARTRLNRYDMNIKNFKKIWKLED